MFKVNQEFLFNEKLYIKGDSIEKPTRRMIELGLVSWVNDSTEAAEVTEDILIETVPETQPETELKPKRKKKQKSETQEELLVDESSEVEIRVKTEETNQTEE